MEGYTTVKCEKCGKEMDVFELKNALYVCPFCGKNNRFPVRERLFFLADEGSFTELFTEKAEFNPIDFYGYKEKLAKVRQKSGENDAVVCGTCTVGGILTAIFVMNPAFMSGSMGSVTGEKITALFEYATAKNLPVIGFSASGGARMQEGIFSLMQMAKTSASVKKHSEKNLFFLSVITDPTMGGVTASFANLGDIIVAEKDARMGFAGKMIIEQIGGEKVPNELQTAENQLKNGFLDGIVDRKEQKEYIIKMLRAHAK